MKIVYIHQYFKTPEEGGAIRSYHLAKKLVIAGYEVEMVTAHNQADYKKTQVEGFTVHYIPVRYHNRFGFIRRTNAFLKFMLFAFRLIKSLENVNLIYATSTPLTVGWLALRIKKKLNIPYFFEVRDLWPDAPIEMGAIKNQFLKKLLFNLEKNIYAHSEGVIALSPPVKETIESRTERPVYLITNFADIDFFNTKMDDRELIDQLHLENHFVIGYTGAIGKVNRLESLLHLAKACSKNDLHIKFLIIGKGSHSTRIKELAKQYDLCNVLFVSHQNKFEIRKYLQLADAVYISFDNPKILETSSPNKFFDALAAGKMIVFNKKGWIKELIEQNKCGFYADPDQPEEVCKIISQFIQDPDKLKLYQKNALQTAQQFSKDKLLDEFINIINDFFSAKK